ncbi:unnamed protein product [Urochloa humidicola]
MSSLHSSSSSPPVLPLLVLSLLLLSGDASSKPIVTPITKDDSTGLYTIPVVKNGAPLVLDLAGPLIWSPCQSPHRTVPCKSTVCKVANRNRPASCGAAPAGGDDPNCACAAFAYNPASAQCGAGDLTSVPLSANATDGSNPLSPAVTFSAYATCTPDALLASLPAGAAGVAGLSRQPLSLPSLVASRLKVSREFALCLPGSGGQTGAAIFGGGPFVLRAAAPEPIDLAGEIRQNQIPLLKNPKSSGAYYFGVRGVAFNQEQLNLPAGALDLDRRRGTGGVVLSTTTRFTTLRSDVYSALINAFDAITRNVPRRKPVPPFQLCYEASGFPMTMVGPAVPDIDLMLDGGGRNWTLPGGNSIVQVDSATLCFAFDSMGPEQAAAFNSPAVIFGAYQMENSLILFDLEKGTFGTSGLLPARRTNCGNFNFAMGSS